MSIKIKDLPDHIDEQITVLGQINVLRQQKKFSFIELGYGDYQVQVVVPAKFAEGLTTQSYIQITGTVKKLPEGVYSKMPIEISASDVKIISKAKADFEQQCPSNSSADIKLEKRHFYFRDPEFKLITILRSQLIQAMRAHFESTSCYEIIPPSFTGVECEGGASLFPIVHPGKSHDKPMTAYLTQSSQFALEMLLPSIGDCYCISPSFRAEHSHTRRHLTEFLHFEAEFAGIMKFDDHLDKLKDLLKGIISHFLLIGERSLKELKKYDRVQELLKMTDDILILEHKDAIKECHQRGIYKSEDDGIKIPFDERDDIPEAQERKLIDDIGKIVFLVKFPKEFKSFYMGLDPEDESRVLGCDVEVPGVGEIIGSGVREGDYDRLYQRLKDHGLKPEDYSEYLDLRSYGFCQTSGMGLGVDRMLVWLLGMYSIRDVVTFPRFPGNLRP
jgi:asparaginyl-tRNA synthetase